MYSSICSGITIIAIHVSGFNILITIRHCILWVRRAIVSIRTAMMSDFVPNNLGFKHITREGVTQNHTRQLAKDFLTNDITSDPAILVLDGTYVYIQKSSNFSFSRRSYNSHKHRPLVKPMIVVTSCGYIVSVLGPQHDHGINDLFI